MSELLPAAGIAVGMVGFFLLGMAMPHHLPARRDWRDALPAVALRFGVASCLCLAVQGAGVDVPAAVWVLALAPSPFSVVLDAHGCILGSWVGSAYMRGQPWATASERRS